MGYSKDFLRKYLEQKMLEVRLSNEMPTLPDVIDGNFRSFEDRGKQHRIRERILTYNEIIQELC